MPSIDKTNKMQPYRYKMQAYEERAEMQRCTCEGGRKEEGSNLGNLCAFIFIQQRTWRTQNARGGGWTVGTKCFAVTNEAETRG